MSNNVAFQFRVKLSRITLVHWSCSARLHIITFLEFNTLMCNMYIASATWLHSRFALKPGLLQAWRLVHYFDYFQTVASVTDFVIMQPLLSCRDMAD